ncbi:4Fe-4S dicluster domain-containing protein [Eggerthella sinensis]|uniref:4Fe-4S dicluster domain-containing protein n=1 Tax=Eggerthella sinensis TaxID=242230 RepID=UPI0022E5E70C|nr:4Fe-4S dicluster domain-containing protein [Eggerthella sinensis]
MRNGFYFDMTACIGCRTCQVACKDKNNLEIGTIFRRLSDFEVGSYPTVQTFHYSSSCNHCEKPACVAACPNAAMYIDEDDGTVQHNDEKCIGCQYCVKACPYGVPQYIEAIQKTHKCDACKPLRENGDQPRAWPRVRCAPSSSGPSTNCVRRILRPPIPSPCSLSRQPAPASRLKRSRRRLSPIQHRCSCNTRRQAAAAPPSQPLRLARKGESCESTMTKQA